MNDKYPGRQIQLLSKVEETTWLDRCYIELKNVEQAKSISRLQEILNNDARSLAYDQSK